MFLLFCFYCYCCTHHFYSFLTIIVIFSARKVQDQHHRVVDEGRRVRGFEGGSRHLRDPQEVRKTEKEIEKGRKRGRKWKRHRRRRR